MLKLAVIASLIVCIGLTVYQLAHGNYRYALPTTVAAGVCAWSLAAVRRSNRR